MSGLWDQKSSTPTVRPVVRRVQILSIPAAWEIDLSSEAVRAIDIRYLVDLCIRVRRVKAKAYKLDGLSIKTAGEVALRWVASYHTEVSWECLELVVVGSWTLPSKIRVSFLLQLHR